MKYFEKSLPLLEIDCIPDDGAVSLKWNEIDEAVGYRIFMSHQNGTFENILNTINLAEKIENLTNGDLYKFIVRAFKKSDNSDSYFVTSCEKSTVPLSPPQKLTAEVHSKEVILKWSQSENSDGYIIYRLDSKINKYVRLMYSTKNIKRIANLKNYEIYNFKVRAYKFIDGIEYKSIYSDEVFSIPVNNGLMFEKSVFLMNNGEVSILSCKYKNDIAENLTWTSSDTSIATVFDGIVTAISKGEAIIIAKSEDNICSASARIIVNRTEFEPINHGKSLKYQLNNGIYKNDCRSAVIMISGELLCTTNQQISARRKGIFSFEESISYLKKVFAESDYVIGCMGTMLAKSLPYAFEQATVNLNAPVSYLDALKYVGFDAVSSSVELCNPPIKIAILETLESLNRYNIACTGLHDENEQQRFIIADINGIMTAFLSYDATLNIYGKLTTDEIGNNVNLYSKESVETDIATAKGMGAEYIVTFIRWGVENSRMIRDNQRFIAQEIADAGANLIVGSHPHMIQEFDIIKSKDNRNVAVAYSLGVTCGDLGDSQFNRNSVILKILLKKTNDIISLESIGYIPCTIKQKNKTADYLTTPLISEYNDEFDFDVFSQYQRIITTSIGNKIYSVSQNSCTLQSEKIKIALHGSQLLANIFIGNRKYILDKSHLMISQLSLADSNENRIHSFDAKYYEKLPLNYRYDLRKNLDEYMTTISSDYLILDLYSAISTPILELNDHIYSNGKAFRGSLFYSENSENFRKVDLMLYDECWQSFLDKYIETIKKHFHSSRIILIKVHAPRYYSVKQNLRVWRNNEKDNIKLTKMENYFIKKVNPVVIDICKFYFADNYKFQKISPITYEDGFFKNASEIIDSIINDTCNNRKLFNKPDNKIQLDKTIFYYDSMIKRNFIGSILSKMNPIDYIMMKTSKKFIRENYNDLLALKSKSFKNLTDILENFNFANNYRLKNVVKLIDEIDKNSFINPNVDYTIMFDEEFFILFDLTKKVKSFIEDKQLLNDIKLQSNSIRFYFEAVQLFQKGYNINSLKLILNNYYFNTKPFEIDLWCSNISKEIVERGKDKLYINNEIILNPFICEFDEPVIFNPIHLSDVKKFGSNFKRKTSFENMFNRKSKAIISESNSNWIIVDLFELCSEMMMYEGACFAVDSFIKSTDYMKSRINEYNSFWLFEDNIYINNDEIQLRMDNFIKLLVNKYRGNIIITRIDLNTHYLNVDNQIIVLKDSSNETLKKNRLIKKWEDYFIANTNCYSIDISKFFLSDDSYASGASASTFEDLFYSSACSIIKYIIKSKPTIRNFDKLDYREQIRRINNIIDNNPEFSSKISLLTNDDSLLNLFI